MQSDPAGFPFAGQLLLCRLGVSYLDKCEKNSPTISVHAVTTALVPELGMIRNDGTDKSLSGVVQCLYDRALSGFQGTTV